MPTRLSYFELMISSYSAQSSPSQSADGEVISLFSTSIIFLMSVSPVMCKSLVKHLESSNVMNELTIGL